MVWRRRVWWIGISVVVAGLAFVLAQQRDSTYSASAVIGVTPGSSIGGPGVNSDAVGFATMQLDRLVGSDAVLSQAGGAAHSKATVETLRRLVSSSTDTAAGTVSVRAEAAGPDDAARLATAVAQAAITRRQAEQDADKDETLKTLRNAQESAIAELGRATPDSPELEEARLHYQSVVQKIVDLQAAPTDTLQLLRSPTLPRGPVNPASAGIAVFAFLLSLVLGAEGIVLTSRLRRSRTSAALAAEPTTVERPQTARSLAGDPEHPR